MQGRNGTATVRRALLCCATFQQSQLPRLLLECGTNVLLDVQLVLGGQLQSVVEGPAIVDAVRGGDVPGALVEAVLLGPEFGHGSFGVRCLIVDAADALIEVLGMLLLAVVNLVVVIISLVVGCCILCNFLVIKAILGGQDGLDGAVLVDHLLLEIFGRPQMFQTSRTVLGLGLVTHVLVEVAVGKLLVVRPDGSYCLLYGFADALVVVFGVSNQGGGLLVRGTDEDEPGGWVEPDGLFRILVVLAVPGGIGDGGSLHDGTTARHGCRGLDSIRWLFALGRFAFALGANEISSIRQTINEVAECANLS